eukprot:gene9671-biopygen1701
MCNVSVAAAAATCRPCIPLHRAVSAAVCPWEPPGGPLGSQDSGAGVARAIGHLLAWVARAWRGRGAGMSCAPRGAGNFHSTPRHRSGNFHSTPRPHPGGPLTSTPLPDTTKPRPSVRPPARPSVRPSEPAPPRPQITFLLLSGRQSSPQKNPKDRWDSRGGTGGIPAAGPRRVFISGTVFFKERYCTYKTWAPATAAAK